MITNMHAQKLTQIVLLILKFSFTSAPQTKNPIGQAEKMRKRGKCQPLRINKIHTINGNLK